MLLLCGIKVRRAVGWPVFLLVAAWPRHRSRLEDLESSPGGGARGHLGPGGWVGRQHDDLVETRRSGDANVGELGEAHKKRWAVCKTTGLCSRFGSRFASQIVEMSSSSSSLLLPPSSALSKKVVKVIRSSTLQGRRRERCSGDKAPAGNVLTETAV